MDHKSQFAEIFKRYLEDKATPAETQQMLTYFDTMEGQILLKALIYKNFETVSEVDAELDPQIQQITDRVFLKLQRVIREERPQRLWKPIYTVAAIAAGILIALAALMYFINLRSELKSDQLAMEIQPGGDRATLRLADGRTINLSEARQGTISQADGITVSKDADGLITYNIKPTHNIPAGDNTVSTPKGGTYQVLLPDGTRVWLNAASTITYATDMSIADLRVVKLSGEAYFEVAHDQQRPFIVKTNDQEVKVLGTHFNINSYADEGRTTTTLAEGSVKVTRHQQQLTLKPGQQAVNDGKDLQLQAADMETALAWKNGNLVFKSATLEQIMRQVQRWYDVQVVYEGKVGHRVFTGGIARNSKLSVLLKILKDSGISFQVRETPQGRTLVIKE